MRLETKIKGEIVRGYCHYCDYLTCRYKKHRKPKKLCKAVREEIKSKMGKHRFRQALQKELQGSIRDLAD